MRRDILRFFIRLNRRYKPNAERLAGLMTSIYLSAVLVVLGMRFNEFSALPLNELGDFLAGVFGPLAVLWLVLGYYQQGRELKISSQALVAQCVELKNSVSQQRLALDISLGQMKLAKEKYDAELLELEESIRPRLIISYINPGSGAGAEWFNFQLSVSNADAMEIEVESISEGVAVKELSEARMAVNSNKKFAVGFQKDESPMQFQISAYCKNSRGKNYGYHFTFSTSGRGKLVAQVPSVTKVD